MSAPDVAVVVGTRGHRVELLWCLDALAAQDLPGGARAEVLVVHDRERGPVLDAAAEHPLVAAGTARLIAIDAVHVAAKRNAGWRAATAALIAFTDDDCRPRPGWLAAFLAAAARDGDGAVGDVATSGGAGGDVATSGGAGGAGALLQGGAAVDPDQAHVALRSSRPRLQAFVPPTPWGEHCSLAVPRAALERVGGLDERYRRAGEDTDLAWRLAEAGVPWVAVPDAIVDHAVTTPGLVGTLRTAARFSETVRVVRRHPGLRRHLPGRVFWQPGHAWLLLALAGLALARRDRLALGLVAPYVGWHASRYGRTPKGVARSLTELPGSALIDATEVVGLVAASAREGTLVL